MKTSVYLAVIAAASAKYATFKPEQVSLEQLMQADQLPTKFYEHGMIGVRNLPGMGELKQQLFTAQVECVKNSEPQFVFPDGTQRTTLATTTLNGVQSEVKGADMTSPACIEFDLLQVDFRELVDLVVTQFTELLSEGESSSNLMYNLEESRFLDSWNEIVESGTQLEHFHSYKADKESDNEFTMDLHKDDGLFIALAPALLVQEGTAFLPEKSGFFVDIQDEVHEVDFKGLDLFFMVGDGAEKWVNPKLSNPIRAVPHAFVSASPEVHRAWYGRMVHPNENVLMHEDGVTFGERRALIQEASSFDGQENSIVETLSVCGEGWQMESRMLQLNCSVDEVYCWMSCHPIDDLEACEEGFEHTCALANGTIADCELNDNNHRTSCAVQCLEPQLIEDNAGMVPGVHFAGALVSMVFLTIV